MLIWSKAVVKVVSVSWTHGNLVWEIRREFDGEWSWFTGSGTLKRQVIGNSALFPKELLPNYVFLFMSHESFKKRDKLRKSVWIQRISKHTQYLFLLYLLVMSMCWWHKINHLGKFAASTPILLGARNPRWFFCQIALEVWVCQHQFRNTYFSLGPPSWVSVHRWRKKPFLLLIK